MQNHKKYAIVLLFLLFLFLVGCATTTAPRRWLPQSSQLQSQAFGGWLQVHQKSKNNQKLFINGELIAITKDTVYVLTDDKLHTIAASDVTKARLVSYSSQAGSMGGLVALGTLSTLSHGVFLVLTAPLLWGIGGGATAASQSRKPIIDYPKRPLKDFKPFARFPHGIPQHLNRWELSPKPYSKSS